MENTEIEIFPAKRPVKKKKAEKVERAIDKLSPAHKFFVKEYVANLGNGSRAYLKAYPTVKNTDTAKANAARLLTNANIKKAIEEEYDEYFKNKDSMREKSKTYQTIHAIAEGDISDVIDMESKTLTVKDLSDIPPYARKAIASIEYVEKETKYGTEKNIKVRLHDKLKALELRAKIQGMIQDKVEHAGEIIIKPAIRPVNDDGEDGI